MKTGANIKQNINKEGKEGGKGSKEKKRIHAKFLTVDTSGNFLIKNSELNSKLK